MLRNLNGHKPNSRAHPPGQGINAIIATNDGQFKVLTKHDFSLFHIKGQQLSEAVLPISASGYVTSVQNDKDLKVEKNGGK